jgi:hypothetical protein
LLNFPPIGLLYQEKSGNHAGHTVFGIKVVWAELTLNADEMLKKVGHEEEDTREAENREFMGCWSQML